MKKSIILNLSQNPNKNEKDWTFKDVEETFKKEELDLNRVDIKTRKDAKAIEGGIKNIFQFRPGERVLKPTFGNTLLKFVHEPVTELVGKQIQKEIRNIFKRWEPRVEILKIITVGNPNEHQWDISVFYKIPMLDENVREFNYQLG